MIKVSSRISSIDVGTILVLSNQVPKESPIQFVVKSLDLHEDIVTNHQIPPEIVHETTGRVLRLHLELY